MITTKENEMKSYNPYICNISTEIEIAKRMSNQGLVSAIAECLECISLGINPSKYLEQAKVYRQELSKRVR